MSVPKTGVPSSTMPKVDTRTITFNRVLRNRVVGPMGPYPCDETIGLETRSPLRYRFGAAVCSRVKYLSDYYYESGPHMVPKPPRMLSRPRRQVPDRHVCHLDSWHGAPGFQASMHSWSPLSAQEEVRNHHVARRHVAQAFG